MKRTIFGVVALLFTAAAVMSVTSYKASAVENPPTPTIVSTNSQGEQLNAEASVAKLSADGRYVGFMSDATNTGITDGNGIADVFVKDTQTGQLIPVSVTPGGQAGNDWSGFVDISGDGRFVLFFSHASDLVPGDTNGFQDLFVRDLTASTTEMLINPFNSAVPANFLGASSSLNYNGRYVLFGDIDGEGVVVRDRVAGTNQLFPGLAPLSGALLSANGEWLVFKDPGCGGGCDAPGPLEIMNIATGQREVVSIGPSGSGPISGDQIFNDPRAPWVSSDGRYVSFVGAGDLYVRDRQTNTSVLEASQVLPENACMSYDGSKLTWLASEEAGGDLRQYVGYKDRATQTTYSWHWMPDPPPAGRGEPQGAYCSGDGNHMTFMSNGYLTSDTNEVFDIYKVSFASNRPQTATFAASADTFVRSGQNDSNAGSWPFLRLQSSGSNRSLVRFDQAAMQNTIGGGSVISATLRLTIVENSNNWGASGRTVDTHRLLTDWAEGTGTETDRGAGPGATWNCAIDSDIGNQAKNCSGSTEWEMGQPNNPSVHPWAETPSATRVIANGQSGAVDFDVTADVQAFMNGTNSNFGWLLKKTNEGQTGMVSFGSRETTPPQLILTFGP